MLFHIMEYRTAMRAKAQHNADATKMSDSEASLFAEMAKLLEERQGG